MPQWNNITLTATYNCSNGMILLSHDGNNAPQFTVHSLHGKVEVVVNNVTTSWWFGTSLVNQVPFSSVFSSIGQQNVLLGYLQAPLPTSGVILIQITDTIGERFRTEVIIDAYQCSSFDCIKSKICMSSCKKCKCCIEAGLLAMGMIALEGLTFCGKDKESLKLSEKLHDLCKLKKKCC